LDRESQTILSRLHRLAAEGAEPPDAALLERYVGGRDARAFEALVWRHAPGVWAACRRVLRHEQDAEDAFQGVWIILALKAGGIGKRESLGPWLHRVAVRVALRARERRSRLPIQADVEAVVKPAADAELRERIDAAIDRLPENHRRAFVLCHLQGLTLEEAAAVLGCPPATVGTWVARAKQRLRDRLPDLSPVALPACVPLAIRTALHAEASLPSVAFLVKGVLNAMFYEKVRTAAVVILAASLFALVSGVGLALAQKPATKAAPPKTEGKRAEREPEEGEKAMAFMFVEAKLNEIEAAHLLGRYAELLTQANTWKDAARKAGRELRTRKGAEEQLREAQEELDIVQRELETVRDKLKALEIAQTRLTGQGIRSTTPILPADRAASPTLEKLLKRLDSIDKRLEALEKKR
jgi:RNA polymerase sigma factor (sigma-70 family)